MGNLTSQYYRVGGHSRQFPPQPSELHSTRLHYRTPGTIVLFCECSHQGGRDGGGERERAGGGGLAVMDFSYCILCALKFAQHDVRRIPAFLRFKLTDQNTEWSLMGGINIKIWTRSLLFCAAVVIKTFILPV